MAKFYAAQSPRGFVNEIVVRQFSSRSARDKWAAEHCDDGGVNASTQGAYAITARAARKLLADCGDDATEMFHRLA